MRKGRPQGSPFARPEECISMKLWQGRLGGDVDERLDRLNKSICYDVRMYK